MNLWLNPSRWLIIVLLVLLSLNGAAAQDQGGEERPAGGTYVVEYGDTLDEIAQRFDVSLVVLAQTNNLTPPYLLEPGQLLSIPADAPPYGAVPPLNPDGTLAEGIGGGGGSEDVYVVQPGDTLDEIAQQYDISLIALLDANGLSDGAGLRPGTVLSIPADAPPYGTVPPREPIGGGGAGIGGGGDVDTYVVQPGDTLDEIAQSFNVSIIVLQEVNGIDPRDPLLPGTVLSIPLDSVPYGAVPPLNPDGSLAEGIGGGGGGEDVYVVQPGDTLDEIAQQYDVSLVSLLDANGLSDGRAVVPGTVLSIPADAPPYGVFPPTRAGEGTDGIGGGGGSGEEYTVQPGDTLDEIAQSYNVSVIVLAQSNGLEVNDTLLPGTVLFIPEDAVPYGQVPPLNPDGSLAEGIGGGGGGEDVYIVQPGDTLDTIAQLYNVSLIALAQENDVAEGAVLTPGTVISIPADAPEYGAFPPLDAQGNVMSDLGSNMHVVQPGDTLDSIGQVYDISPACLAQTNDVVNGRIFPGQVLDLAGGCPPYGS